MTDETRLECLEYIRARLTEAARESQNAGYDKLAEQIDSCIRETRIQVQHLRRQLDG